VRVQLASLDCSNGFRMYGSGALVSSDDVNGDGYGDIIIGKQPSTCFSFVVFGKSSGWSSELDLTASLDGSNGFAFCGDESVCAGSFVSSGDVNGDGYADVIFGGYQGSQVVFGKGSGWNAVLDVSVFLVRLSDTSKRA